MADTFICYSTRHPVYAELIEQRISASGNSSFRDKPNLPGGLGWVESIDQAIEATTVVVVILTQEALASEQVLREISLALSLNKPIIPLIMGKVENTDTALKSLGLGDIQAINFPDLGLSEALARFDSDLRRELDTWAPIQQVIDKLGHFSWKARSKAVIDLIASNDTRVLDALAEALAVEDSNEVKDTIVRGMEYFDDPRAIDIILDEFTLRGFGVEVGAALDRMLDRFSTTEQYLIDGLEKINDDFRKEDWAFRFCALGSELCRDVGLQTLIILAKSSTDEGIRARARNHIFASRHPRTQEVFQEMLQDESNTLVRRDIEQFINRLKRQNPYAT